MLSELLTEASEKMLGSAYASSLSVRADGYGSDSQVQTVPELSASASLVFNHWGYRHASRNHFAVRDLNLSIPAGQRVLLLGASGIGKSTILSGAAGLLGTGIQGNKQSASDGSADSMDDSLAEDDSPVEDADGGFSQGEVLIDGVAGYRARGRVGLVLQDPEAQVIFERLGDNVAFGPENMNVEHAEIWERVIQSLKDVGLDDLQLHRSTMHLSGGQLQRLSLAGALAMRPGVLLLDEPTANLDPDGVKQIVGAVRDVLNVNRSTMVLVEHRADPWIDLIDRVVVLGLDSYAATDDGSGTFRQTVIMADGSPEEVFSSRNLDFSALGIWLPERFQRAEDRIGPVHTKEEPEYRAWEGTGEPLLLTRDLAIGRQGRAIAQHVDLDFRPGQITALTGANGTGKSTLALTLAGLLAPVAGAVLVSGDLRVGTSDSSPIAWKSTQLASRISYVFQNPEHQFAKATVLDEVMLGPLRTGMDEQEARVKALALLEHSQLRQYAHMNPYTLSGGEKRRLTVASALAAAPKILIFDEPTFGQDRSTWMQMVQLIHGLRGDGVSIIVVTHDRELVTALDARVVELSVLEESNALLVSPSSAGDGTPKPADQDESTFSLASRAADSAGQVVEVSPSKERQEAPRQASHSHVLASLNPSFRLIGGFITALVLVFSLDWVSSTITLTAEFVFLAFIGLSPRRVIKSTWPLFIGAPGSALAVILYGKSGGSVWWHWGMILVTDRSLTLALATAIRILAIGIPAIISVLGIDATDLADSMSQILHLPDRFVYGGLAGLRLFSVLRDDWAALTASRRSRGLGDDSKIRSFLPQSFALLVLSIRRSTMLATAMEARGFGGITTRSRARVSTVHPRDFLFVLICLVVPLVALLAAWLTGSFSFFGN